MTLIYPYIKIITLVFGVILGLFAVHKILKSPHPIWNALKSSLVGVISLVVLDMTSDITMIYIPLSLMNIGISSLAGIPGVCMLIIINFIFLH